MEKRRECSGGRRGVRGVPLAAIGFVAVSLAVIAATATPTFTIDSVRQRFPWSNTVDIGYTVGGLEENEKCDIAFSAKIGDGESFDATNATVEANGTFTQQWDPPAGIQTTNCTVTGVMTPVIGGGDYMIVDLTTGEITYENIETTQEAANTKYNTSTYKTTKMAFRKIAAASGVHLQTNKIARTWSFPSDYYIGVFPVTVAQYAFMTNAGANIASMGEDGLKPMNYISWQTIRGSTTDFNSIPGIGHAATSNQCCISVLNRRVRDYNSQGTAKAKFDLPTEAAWEYAAAAGTSGEQAYFFGETYDAGAGLGEYAWYSSNSGSARHPVGGKWANPWGLYDVYGNVWEWCRDRYVDGNLTNEMPSEEPSYGFEAASSGSNSNRRRRGGSYGSSASYCSSVYRSYNYYGSADGNNGFRLSWGCVPTGDYMVVDLKTGAVTYETDVSNGEYNTDEYKTTKMAFRKIPAGDYYVQDGTSTIATMASDYYIGIFEVTVGQYTLMTNKNASVSAIAANMKPQAYVSWLTIRGKSDNSDRATAFGGGLTSGPIYTMSNTVATAGNVGIAFDLPTEAMWEVAARAMPAADASHAAWAWFFIDKKSSDYNSTSVSNNLLQYAWWCANAYGRPRNDNDGYGTTSSGKRVVGTKLANPWGLYDIYGNVSEWCLDTYVSSAPTWTQTPCTDTSYSSGSYRCSRGGSYANTASNCRSGYRNYNTAVNRNDFIGFRLASIVRP